MTDRKSKGNYGESLAREYLIREGYEILESNYRFMKGEIDLIALNGNNLLVFVEVKLRKSHDFGHPETFVLPGQELWIMRAAEDYIFSINWKKDIRFDIIAILEKSGELLHIRDAFY